METLDNHCHLSRRERQIMDILYLRGEASVLEIQEQLPNPPTATAIRTMLRILEDKDQVKRRKRGREFLYASRQPRKSAGLKALQHVLETFYGGSLARALSAQLTHKDGPENEKELREMMKMIEETRAEGN